METKEKIEKKKEKIKKLENSYTEKSENRNYNDIREIIKNLKKEIKKYELQEVIEIKENDCIITCYSDLITRFIDDRGVDNE